MYNLACPASPVHYQHDPVQTTKTSVHGADQHAGLAKTAGEVFRPPRPRCMAIPSCIRRRKSTAGNVNPIGPRACYDEGKRCAETLFFDYWRQHKLQIKVARIFNTYGPRMHPNDGAWCRISIVQALLQRDITIYGDGAQTRSFCYVDDLVDGLIRLMNTPDAVTGPINIGNPAEVLDARTCIDRHRNDRLSIAHCSSAQAVDDPLRRQPDISQARSVLDGIRRLL